MERKFIWVFVVNVGVVIYPALLLIGLGLTWPMPKDILLFLFHLLRVLRNFVFLKFSFSSVLFTGFSKTKSSALL